MTIRPSQASQVQLFIDTNCRKDLCLDATGEAAVSTTFEVFNNHKRTPRDNFITWVVKGNEWRDTVVRFTKWAERYLDGTFSVDIQTVHGSANVTIHVTCSRKDQLAKAFDQCEAITLIIRKEQAWTAKEEAKPEATKTRPNAATVATVDLPREEREHLAAACSGCGGWTTVGGMSQHADQDGCSCHAKEDRGANLQTALDNNQRTMRDTNELDDVRHFMEVAIRQLAAINKRPMSGRDANGIDVAVRKLGVAAKTIRDIQDRMDKTVTAVMEA